MTDKERKLALYCLKASSDYHSEVCEECINYPNCDHTIQDDVTETIIKELEQTDGDLISRELAKKMIRAEFKNLSERTKINTVINEVPSADIRGSQTSGDLISRQAVINALYNANLNFTVVSTINFKDYQREIQQIVDNVVIAQEKAINELPSAEKTAEWTKEDECSNCEKYIYVGDRDNYCPHCGVKRRGRRMSRLETNRMVIEEMDERAKCKPEGTYEEMVVFQLSVIAVMLADISKSLAILADKAESEDNE